MPSRREHLQRAVESIGVVTRDFAASGAYPFKNRRLGRAPMTLLWVLSRSDDGLGIGALAAALAVTSGAVSQTVDALRAEGLVTSEVSASDSRARVIRLTEAARTEVEVFEQEYLDALAPRFDSLSSAEMAELDRLLAKLRGEAP